MNHLGEDIHDGDVLLSNHPCAGGSHLPDLTVITPVRIQNMIVIRSPFVIIVIVDRSRFHLGVL